MKGQVRVGVGRNRSQHLQTTNNKYQPSQKINSWIGDVKRACACDEAEAADRRGAAPSGYRVYETCVQRPVCDFY